MTQALGRAAGAAYDGAEGVLADVGQRSALQPSPHPFDGIEIGGIGGKALDRQPSTVLRDPVANDGCVVRLDAVPQQDDATAHVAAEMLEEPQDGRRAYRARME